MTPWIKLLLLFALLTTLSGCATQRQLRMERDLDEMKKRLAKAELSLAAQGKSLTGELEQRLDTLGRTQADLQVGLDTLKIDVQSMNGRFEDQSRDRDELRSDMLLVKDDFGLKLTSLEDRVMKLEENRGALGGGIVGGMPNSPEALYEVALEKNPENRRLLRCPGKSATFSQGQSPAPPGHQRHVLDRGSLLRRKEL